MIGTKTFSSKEELLNHFGSKLGWKIERGEFVNIEQGIGDYQTADMVEENVYPEPLVYYKEHIEKEHDSLEETYFWFLHFLRFDLGFPKIHKIYDIFSASESSAMFGSNAQRLSIQQDRASQYLVQIGQLVKQLFPLVRELRVIDERLEMYHNWDKNKSADISLKHLYINLVEGGTQNPDSVYGLAQKVGYTILPDLFLGTHVYKLENIDKEIDEGSVKEFNKNVRTVLKRKLYLYINWKLKTQKELEAKRKFQLQYLRQHWSVIKLYMAWIRPYLKTAARLERNEGFTESADIINAFDNSKAEIEILAEKPVDITKKKDYSQVIIVNFRYKSMPKMSYNAQYGQQNIAHSGTVEITTRAYAWHKSEIEAFKKMRQQEDIEMLKGLNAHIGGAFDALGEDFEKYLIEAEEPEAVAKKKEEEEKKKKEEEELKKVHAQRNKYAKLGPLQPFAEVSAGFGELFSSIFSVDKAKKKTSEPKETKIDKGIAKNVGKGATIMVAILCKTYKKAHRLMAW